MMSSKRGRVVVNMPLVKRQPWLFYHGALSFGRACWTPPKGSPFRLTPLKLRALGMRQQKFAGS
jgi:hypothetical protein